MPVESEENVVKLQIPVDDAVFVKVLESKTNLGRVESGGIISDKPRNQIRSWQADVSRTELSSTQTALFEYAASSLRH